MRFSQDFIEKVRDANNIAEIIGQYTELKGSGHRLMGRCPFPDHSDKSPSFSVTEDNQLYFCYGCKKGGNLFTFLETFNGMSFPEAVEFLARRANIPMPENEEKTRRPGAVSSDQKDLFLKINKAAAVYFYQLLKSTPANHPAREYMAKRGLTEEIVEKFRIGLTSDEWQGLGKLLESKKVPLKLAETLGLLKPKKNPPRGGPASDAYFDLFRDRLMFPIFNPTGDVVGFGGRTLGDALPKYVNSSDSPVFNKGKILYGLHETGKFIRAQDEAIVVEGYMDAISLYAAGIKNVVAILGTAFTPDHAKLLKRYTLNVKMLLDGDEAGITGAERSLPILLEAGLMPKGFVLPEKMDPDDFVKANGADALRVEIDRAPELFTLLLLKRWMASYHGLPSEKVQIVEEAASAMRSMTNRQLYDLYVMELGRQLDIDLGWVRRSLTQSQQALAQKMGAAAARNSATAHQPAPGSGPGSGPVPNAHGAQGPRGHMGPQQNGPAGNRPTPQSGGAPLGQPRGQGQQTGARPQPYPSQSRADDLRPPEHFGFDPGEPLPEPPPNFEQMDNGPMPDEIESALTEVEIPRVTLKGAPKDEAFVLSLLLHEEKLMQELVEAGHEEVQQLLSHPGIRDVLGRAVDLYRQDPEGHSHIAAKLTGEVDQPALLVVALPFVGDLKGAEAALEKARQAMGDYLQAIRNRYLKNQAKQLAQQLREGVSPEKLEEFMTLQRGRLNPEGQRDGQDTPGSGKNGSGR